MQWDLHSSYAPCCKALPTRLESAACYEEARGDEGEALSYGNKPSWSRTVRASPAVAGGLGSTRVGASEAPNAVDSLRFARFASDV